MEKKYRVEDGIIYSIELEGDKEVLKKTLFSNFDALRQFSDDKFLCFVEDNGKWILIDEKGARHLGREFSLEEKNQIINLENIYSAYETFDDTSIRRRSDAKTCEYVREFRNLDDLKKLAKAYYELCNGIKKLQEQSCPEK